VSVLASVCRYYKNLCGQTTGIVLNYAKCFNLDLHVNNLCGHTERLCYSSIRFKLNIKLNLKKQGKYKYENLIGMNLVLYYIHFDYLY